MKEKIIKFKTKSEIKLELEITKKGFTLWSKENWLIDASCLIEDDSIRLCKKVKNPWGNQRFGYELIPEITKKGYINQFHRHTIKKVGAKE